MYMCGASVIESLWGGTFESMNMSQSEDCAMARNKIENVCVRVGPDKK